MITVFTFGYWGWGNATDKLVLLVAAVEKERGFKPPFFIDARMSRKVRAKGFIDNTFGDLIGDERYLWLDGLGNAAIKEGGETRLKDPAKIYDLLQIIEEKANDNRRVIVFCACEYPKSGGVDYCHRVLIAKTLMKEAHKKNAAINIVEWPGHDPVKNNIQITVNDTDFMKVLRGAKSLSVAQNLTLSEIGSIPWFTPVKAASDDSSRKPVWIFTGPGKYVYDDWHLPVFKLLDSLGENSDKEIQQEREAFGFLAIQ